MWSDIQVLDQLTLLVDKSLVVAENTGGRTRYRLLETVRQYALEKLAESGEADAVRARHRDHYTAMAALLDAPARTDYEQRLEQAEAEIDNLRAAFGWSRENSRRRAGVGAGNIAAAAVVHTGPHPGRAGLVRRRPHRPATHITSRWRLRCARGRSPTRRCSTRGWPPAASMDQAQQAAGDRPRTR